VRLSRRATGGGAMRINARIFCVVALLQAVCSLPGLAQDAWLPVHGLWVWKSPTVLAAPHAAEALRDFCQAQSINEVYISVPRSVDSEEEGRLVGVIRPLHAAHIRVEALLSSTEADEPGKHRDLLLDKVRNILAFNQKHSGARFDGIHLDVEPQQRPENKGPGNLRFLPGLTDAFRAVRALAEPAGLTVNADIQNKLLKGSVEQRQMLLSAVPRVTLMLYELDNPEDGHSAEQQEETLRTASGNFLATAYKDISDVHLARMAIALRTADYAARMPEMLRLLDDANRANPHYLGWARHSYNDTLATPAGQ
jgi:hypothetical protein